MVQCRDFFTKLSGTWGEQLFLTTILLNANVAFLSIPSLSSPNTEGVVSSRSVAKIPCYLSIIASFACMVISMVLIQQHKGQEKSGLSEFVRSVK
ncbi:hypothetical protein H2248_003620 [Termitomyces sp. 'cryptogamus']|nr:hypothetical protein H2248_003620 [Termitomyces sp. 'cryptogamus']